MLPLIVEPYNRQKAIAYAHQWAFSRNPRYYNFDSVGGDCTSFISQCVYAGNGVMNFKRDVGWYYISAANRAAAWSSVVYFHKFMTTNQGVGPFGRNATIAEMIPGDIIQLHIDGERFHHSLIIVDILGFNAPGNILIATHYYDSDYRPLSTYQYKDIRFIHIEGVRRQV